MTDLPDNAKKYSFKLLSYRGRSERELRERLNKKGFSEEIVSCTLRYLKQAGYIDDRALAVNLKRDALKNRLLGYNGAKSFMLKRGLSIEVIKSALDYDENIELQNAKKLRDKKFKSMKSHLSISERKRFWNFLARRGYSLSAIRKTLKDCKFTEEDLK